jgi:hypothetical protein
MQARFWFADADADAAPASHGFSRRKLPSPVMRDNTQDTRTANRTARAPVVHPRLSAF